MVLARAADNFTTGGAADTLPDDGPGTTMQRGPRIYM
jgi:hypothetical protein